MHLTEPLSGLININTFFYFNVLTDMSGKKCVVYYILWDNRISTRLALQ